MGHWSATTSGLQASFALIECLELEAVDDRGVVVADPVDLLSVELVVRAVVGLHDAICDLLDLALELLALAVHVILLCF